jgi:hypothetical protein
LKVSRQKSITMVALIVIIFLDFSWKFSIPNCQNFSFPNHQKGDPKSANHGKNNDLSQKLSHVILLTHSYLIK